MDFSFTPSLKHRALVKIAVTLFHHVDIQEFILKKSYIILGNTSSSDVVASFELLKKELKTVENEVLKLVLKLPLPDLIKNELLNFVEALGWELMKWRFYYPHVGCYKKYFTKFPWTPQGTIDKKKASELYVRDEILSVITRYYIACKECLEDCICTLWNQLKKLKLHKEITKPIPFSECPSPLVSFWSHYMKRKLHRLSRAIREYCRLQFISPCLSLYEYMFHYSVAVSITAATRFFFQKLTPEQKEKLLLPSAIYSVKTYNYKIEMQPWNIFAAECCADNSAFLISNLNREQQKKMLSKYPHSLLKSFLVWPRQTFFMELAAKSMFCSPTHMFSDFTPEVQYYSTPFVQSFASEVEYCKVLKVIASKILSDSIDYNYRKLFIEFWHGSCYTYKKYVIDNYASDSILSAVFKGEDEENLQLVLKDVFISRKRKTFCE